MVQLVSILFNLIEGYRICTQDFKYNKREFLNTISDATDFVIKYLWNLLNPNVTQKKNF